MVKGASEASGRGTRRRKPSNSKKKRNNSKAEWRDDGFHKETVSHHVNPVFALALISSLSMLSCCCCCMRSLSLCKTRRMAQGKEEGSILSSRVLVRERTFHLLFPFEKEEKKKIGFTSNE